MSSKKELIEKKLNEAQEYAEKEKLPFVHKISEMREKYDIAQIVALFQRFIVPAKDCLSEYIDVEMGRVKLMLAASGDADSIAFTKYEMTIEQKEVFVQILTYVIKVIEL